MGTGDVRGEFLGSGGDRDEYQRPEKDGEGWVKVSPGREAGMWNLGSEPGSDRQLPRKHCPKPLRGSMLPLWWKIIHRSCWKLQVLASELSLAAFILLLVMVFSKSWLCLSRSCFYQRWPADISSRIYMSSHIMSMGLLHNCDLKSCSHPENGKDSFKLWTNHPFFGVAKITSVALGLGLVFTIWLHLPYLPGLQRLSYCSWVGPVMSFCEVIVIFFTLMLFPINLWIFELKKKHVSTHWLELFCWLVGVCPICHLCMSCSCASVQDSLKEQIVSKTFVNQEDLDSEQEKASL